MHTYTARWPEKFDADVLPDIDDLRFRSALDVVAWAEHDRLVGRWRNWPETWHVDERGELTCYCKYSTGDTIRRYADHPDILEHSVATMDARCGNRWFIVESRPEAVFEDDQVPGEGDVAAFVEVRHRLASFGIALVDDVIFDVAFHWWSMQELVSGSTDWPTTEPLLSV